MKRCVESESSHPVPMVGIVVIQKRQDALYGTRFVFMSLPPRHQRFQEAL
jgi:hypothetical protein